MQQRDVIREIVHIDGRSFKHKRFVECQMVYSGGPLMQFESCSFLDCTWTLDGPAASTLLLMRSLYLAAGFAAIEPWMDFIRTGKE